MTGTRRWRPALTVTAWFSLLQTRGERSGTGEGIWKLTNGTSTELWNGQGAQVFGGPAIAPDGRHIAFSVRQHGQTLLCAMKDDGIFLYAARATSKRNTGAIGPGRAGSESGPLGGPSIKMASRRAESLPHMLQRTRREFVTISHFPQ